MNDVVVIVEKSKCNPKACDYLCMRVCPRNKAGDECIVVDQDKKVAINEEVCIACLICPKKCPFKALKVVRTPKELKKNPVHRFGQNAFRLYGLPIPKKGQVIGLLGANGIGKSTAINLLSGELMPNLGDWTKVATKEELIEFFGGTEIQQYYEDMFNKKLDIAYKPQYIELIPKKFKGKVKDLLKKTDETGKFEEIVDKLEIRSILERDINSISGGELQRVAIAATLLKKGNVFFFDEPSSYLDIRQRLKVAKIVRGLAMPERSTFVVEHDLIMLDYMTDLIHIFYGEKGAYGVVSFPYSSRIGINSYLSGYLREENMQFRDEEIKFVVKEPARLIKREVMVAWPHMRKSYKDYHLEVEAGHLFKGEVVGVVGPNGIGKTTFARMLNGEVKPDEGEPDLKIKISYKPQYIKTSSEMSVQDYLETFRDYAQLKHYFRHLDLNVIMKRKLCELSGGELQRVMVAGCLLKEADFYLIDEPAAHLDVEQRMAVAKAIKEIIHYRHNASALVIDHDIMFLDFISERLLVFSGVPAVTGHATGPFEMREGMNKFLQELGITFRRDEHTHRPRANKPGSQKDLEQKKKGEYYYS